MTTSDAVSGDVERDPFGAARRAAQAVAGATGVARHDVAIVLGSGWGDALDELGDRVADVPVEALPGFAAPRVGGHGASVVSCRVAERNVLVLTGRVHRYEGHSDAAVVHGVRTAVSAGCRVVVLTNAAGGIREGLHVGEAVLIADHLNLTGASPLRGPEPPPPLLARFVDLTDLYARRLRALAQRIDPALREGVYAGLPGPHYETPAEIRMLRTLGADLVGMSTVLEAIAARHLEAEVLGVSLVTNLAAGLSATALDHREVIAEGRASARRVGALVRAVIEQL